MIVSLARGHGVESYQCNGNDVIEVYEITQQAVARIRSGDGPIFLEFKTYRWREHCGPNYDNDLGYRTETEFLEWKKKCPLTMLKAHLLERSIITQRDIDVVIGKVRGEIHEAVTFAKASPFPEDHVMMEDVYVG